MSFQKVRAHIESKVFAAFRSLSPPVEVVFDNTFESPPSMPYVLCTISYVDNTEPVICPDGTAVENLKGNLQLSIYAPRGRGMNDLESYAAQAMVCMNRMYDKTSDVRVKCGPINGPVSSLTGTEPYAMVTISCAFGARYEGI